MILRKQGVCYVCVDRLISDDAAWSISAQSSDHIFSHPQQGAITHYDNKCDLLYSFFLVIDWLLLKV